MKTNRFLTLAVLAVAAMSALFAGCKKNEEPIVPVITIGTQPTAPAALTEGAVAGTLTVAATATEGATLTYQWYTNTSASNSGGTKIDGATSASYALPTTLAAGTHYYYCEVGAKGAVSVCTGAVTVTVAAPTTYPVTGRAGTLDWSLDEEGTLTVSGTGAMPDYAAPSAPSRAETTAAPWSAYAAQIRVAVIAEGVTSVGDNAFAGLTVVVTVTLPESVERIGDGAFAGCSVLVEIDIPAGAEIGEGAFEGCDELPEEVIPIPVTGLTVEPTTLTLIEGDTMRLTATVLPANATDTTVTWSTDNPAVATVDAATGKVTAIAPGTATITALAIVPHSPNGGITATCAVTVEAPPAIILQSFLQQYKELCAAFENQYVLVDSEYSTLAARQQSQQSLTESETVASTLWDLAYQVIDQSNRLPELITLADSAALAHGLPHVMSAAEIAEHTGNAFANRATAYFFLKTLWGGVPLTMDTETLWQSLPRGTVQDVVWAVYDDIDRAEDLSARPFTALNGFVREVIFLQENDGANKAIEALTEKIGSEGLVFVDTNADGRLDAQDDNTVAVLAYLLLAEAYQKEGNIQRALENVNVVSMNYGQGPVVSADDISRAIKTGYSILGDTGMKFMNAVRWGETASWGNYALLPIPAKARMQNSQLTQNPGW